MRLINEDAVMEIIERVTNEAVEKKQPKYLIQPRIIAEIAGLPTIEAEPDKMLRDTVAELSKAKRLLKAAVEDIHELLCDKKNLDGNGQGCNICSYIEQCPCCKECTIRENLRNWRYADEALELIGEDGDSE